MSPETRFDHLSQPDETLRLLTPADVDIPAMRAKLVEAGYNLDIGEAKRRSLAEKTFKRRSTGRGPGMVAVIGEEKAAELFAWCKARSEGGPRLKLDEVIADGSEGRGLRQLSADIIQLATDPEINEEKIKTFCLRTNQRVMKGMLHECQGKKAEKEIVRKAFEGVPEPASTFASVPSGSVAELWTFITLNN